jgi:hypothetical protein
VQPRQALSASCDCGCNHLALIQRGAEVNVRARACSCGLTREHTATVAMSSGDPMTMLLGSELRTITGQAYPRLVAAGLIRFGGR